MAIEDFTQEEIDQALNTRVSLPAYHSAHHKEDYPAILDHRLGKGVEHVVIDVGNELINDHTDIVVPEYRSSEAIKRFMDSIMTPYANLCAWFQGTDPQEDGFPTKQYVRQIFANVYHAMNPENSQGRYVRVYMNELSKAFGFGPLEEKWQRRADRPVKDGERCK